jgi:chorismate mutase
MTSLRVVFFVSLLVALTGASALAQNPPVSSDASNLVSDPGESVQARGIDYWRGRIDHADRRIIGLLNERAGYVAELIPLKAKASRVVRDPKREQEVLMKLEALNRGPLPDKSIVRIYEAIMAEMRALQEKGGAGQSDR